MQRQRSDARTVRRAPRAMRWIGVDARDVSRIEAGASLGTDIPVSVAQAVARWRRRIESTRLLAVVLRGALIGLASACVLEAATRASGRPGAGWWLAAAALAAAVFVVVGLLRRTSDGTAARMLDRDLGLGAAVSTALELEGDLSYDGDAGKLRALALADGRAALARSLPDGRVRLVAYRLELSALALLLVTLVGLVLVPRETGTRSGSGIVRSSTRPHLQGSPALGQPAKGTASQRLPEYRKPVHTPPLAQVVSGAQAGGKTPYSSGHSPYAGGIRNSSKAGAIQPVSQTIGPAGSKVDVKSTRASSSTSEGAAGHRRGDVSSQKGTGGTPGSASTRGAIQGLSPSGAANPNADASKSGTGVQASSSGGSTRGGKGSSAAGSSQGTAARQGTPGGATAGGTKGGRSIGAGVVPQLGAGTALPLQPGYEAVAGRKGGAGEDASSTEGGGGGASHSGQAEAGSATNSAGDGVPFVPPGASSVSGANRLLLLGYFGSFSRVTSSGW